MQLHIQKTDFGASDKEAEWVIIEMQGDLESRIGDCDTAGKFIGDLHYSKNVPILIIGHHILYGKIVDLDKPFVAIKKESRV